MRQKLFPFIARVVQRASELPAWVAVALGVAVMLPSLWTGWVADDDIHRLLLREHPSFRGLDARPLDLFRFATGDPARFRELVEEGMFPWWAEPGALLAFFRPLASLSHWVDAKVWPESAWSMHLHNLAWYAALLALVWPLLLRFSSSRAAASVALLLYAVDDAHAPAVGWIANRNMLMAVALAVPVVLLHDDYRTRWDPKRAILAHGLFALALFAGEGAYAALAFLVAYALLLDRGPPKARVLSLTGYVAIGLGFRVAAAFEGYGVFGSGLYFDPVRDPLGFTSTALSRLPALLLGLFAFPTADLWEVYPLFKSWLRPVVLVVGSALLLWLASAFHRELSTSRNARFWAVSCVLASIPLCAAFPHDRLSIAPGIAAMGLMGELFSVWRQRVQPRAAIALLFAVHFLLAPVLAPLRSADVGRLATLLQAQNETVPKGSDVRAQTLLLLNPPLDPFGAYFSAFREARREARPKRVYWFATGVDSIRVTGVDERTLTLRPSLGFLSSSSQLMLRDPARRFERDQEIVLEACSIRVEEVTHDGRPQQIRVRFERPLDHPSFSWMKWGGHGYTSFVPPAPGQSIELPRVDLWQVLFG